MCDCIACLSTIGAMLGHGQEACQQLHDAPCGSRQVVQVHQGIPQQLHHTHGLHRCTHTQTPQGREVQYIHSTVRKTRTTSRKDRPVWGDTRWFFTVYSIAPTHIPPSPVQAVVSYSLLLGQSLPCTGQLVATLQLQFPLHHPLGPPIVRQ